MEGTITAETCDLPWPVVEIRIISPHDLLYAETFVSETWAGSDPRREEKFFQCLKGSSLFLSCSVT